MIASIKLSLDPPSWLLELESLADISALPLEIVDGLVEFTQSPEKFVTIKTDSSAASATDECVVRLYPTDRLLGLVFASRTRNLNLCIVEHGAIHSSENE